jgi:putative ABC transport system permease protein
MVVRRIALRNLNRQKRRSILLGGALAFGIMVLMMVNGVVGGILKSIETNFSNIAVGHIFFAEVEKNEKGRIIYSIKDDAFLMDTIKKLGIEPTYIARRTMSQGILVANGESFSRGLSGVEWKEETELAKNLDLVSGSLKDIAGTQGIVISVNQAEKLNLIPKKEPDATVKSAWSKLPKAEKEAKQAAWDAAREAALKTSIGETVLVELQTVHGQQNLGEFQVKAIYQAQYDFYAYMDRAYLNKLTDLPENGYNQFGMFLKNYSDIDKTTVRLFDVLKTRYNMVPMDKVNGRGFDTIVNDLKKESFSGSKFIITNLNNEIANIKSIFSAVQMVAFAFFILLLLVIMVGITNTFRIVVFERTREIGTMRALGMQRKEVRNVFLWEALFLSIIGTLGGFALSGILLTILGAIKWNVMAEMNFFLNKGHLMITINPVVMILTLVLVAGLTLLAALIPARRAAKMEPALALRTSY